jgi:prepilin-type N-terminal cleavage/methylation domain-containing protein
MLSASNAAPTMVIGCRRNLDVPQRLWAAKGRAAFTIIELVVVLLILSVLAAVAAPTFYRSLVHHRLESAARRVKQDLEYLRDTSRAKSTTLACEFSGTSYTLDEPSIQHLDHAGAYTIDLAATPYFLDGVM